MKREMNLLLVTTEKKKPEDSPRGKGRIVFGGLLMAVLVIYGALAFLDWRCQNEIAAMDAMIAAKADDQVIYNNLSLKQEVLEHRQLLLEAINQKKELPLQTLVEIHQALPAGIQLSNYDFQDRRLVISGETGKKETILEFKEKLATVAVFNTINLVNTNKDGAASTDGAEVWAFTFEIEVAEV